MIKLLKNAKIKKFDKKIEDLYYSLNKVDLYIDAIKKGEKWELDIKLNDIYDYSEVKKIDKYYRDTKSIPKSIFSSTIYNLAWFSMKSNVMKEYKIYIELKINSDFEVSDK